MRSSRPDPKRVTLTLQAADGGDWRLSLSGDCLRFIGRYRRVDGFCIDAGALFEGVRKLG